MKAAIEHLLSLVGEWCQTPDSDQMFLATLQPAFYKGDSLDGSGGFGQNRHFTIYTLPAPAVKDLATGDLILYQKEYYRLLRLEPLYFQRQVLYYKGTVVWVGEEDAL